jgi:heme-degrading monooxygenase HmoA
MDGRSFNEFRSGRIAMHISREGNLVTLINVFETTPEQQQALIEQWLRFTEEVKKEPGYLGTALHRSSDGARVVNYAQWRSEADFNRFLQKYREQFAQFGQHSSRMDPHVYEVVSLDER